jgi:RNA polymerase sigma-70 factor (ECF subfamily)
VFFSTSITSREQRLLDPARTDQPANRFDSLFRRNYPRLVGLVQRVVGDRLDAEEVVQETFVRLAASPVRERPDDEVAAWTRRVALNLSFNRLRDRRAAVERAEKAARLDPAPDDPTDPARAVLRLEEQVSVRRALAELPERQRDCLLLRHSGYSYAEIAATLEIAVGSVGVILARGERAFRETYQERNP